MAAIRAPAWAKAGSNMMTTGLQAGILAKFSAVVTTVENLEAGMRKVVTDCYTAWRGSAVTLMENVLAGLASKKQEAVDTAAGVMAAVRESGFKPILDNALDLVLRGITTTEEVRRTIYTTD